LGVDITCRFGVDEMCRFVQPGMHPMDVHHESVKAHCWRRGPVVFVFVEGDPIVVSSNVATWMAACVGLWPVAWLHAARLPVARCPRHCWQRWPVVIVD
jgi:hypothetical protein